MPDAEENIWGHFLFSNFWFHEEIGSRLQKAVKGHTHKNIKAVITFQYGIFSPHPNADFTHAVTITMRTQPLQATIIVLLCFMIEFQI